MFLKTIPRPLNYLVSSALILLVLKIFVFNNIAEIFNGAHELGVILEGVLGSVLASYIFYLIVVHVKEVHDKRVIYPHIVKWAQIVVSDSKNQLSAFEKASAIELSFSSLTEETVEKALKLINPRDNAPLVFSLNNYANWFQYFEYYRNRSKMYISKIMSQLIFLDAKLVSLITNIDDSSHFSTVELFVHRPPGNQDLSAWASSFYEYCQFCKELDYYLQKELPHVQQG